MSDAGDTQRCTRCGNEYAAASPLGLCPACLFTLGMSDPAMTPVEEPPAAAATAPPEAVPPRKPTPRSRFRLDSWLVWPVAGVVATSVLAFFTFSRVTGPGISGSSSSDRHAHPVRFTLTLPNEIDLLDGAQFAVSPDGVHLVIAARSPDRRSRLWLRRLESLEWRELPRTEGAAIPFWSPDGRHIGFFADRALKRIDIANGLAQTICDAPVARGGTWGVEGVIVFAGSSGLMRVPASGGVPQPLFQDREGGPHAWPQFLPDGRRFLYAQSSGRSTTIVSDPETGETRQIADGRGLSRLVSDLLLVSRGTTLEVQPLDTDRGEPIGEPRPIAGADGVRGDAATGPEFSASSTVLVYRRRQGRRTQLAWFDREGRVVGSMTGEPDDYQSFAVSPSGRHVAAVHRDTGRDGASIWLHDVNGGRVVRITQGAPGDRFPVWSPDERRIAYRAGRNGERDLFTTSVDGGGAEQELIRSEEWKEPTDWSKDGRFLIYTSRSLNDGTDIWMLPIMGNGKAQPIVQTPGNESQGVLSPDVRWLAYTSDESGRDEIYVRPFPPSEGRWQVSNDGGTRARWSPGGRELYFLSGDGRLMSVEIPQPASSNAFQYRAARTLFHAGNADDFAVGTRMFLMQLTAGEPSDRQLEVVLNWRSELRP